MPEPAGNRPPPATDARLAAAVAAGIISADQAAAIRALPDSQMAGAAALEARREINAVSIAYFVGGAAVLFAFGWFIVDRWRALGPGGILAVSLVYAALFALTSRTLARYGFHSAAGVAAFLTVGMTPLVAWALLDLGGLWYEPGHWSGPPFALRIDVLESLRWIPLELATALAALVALRRVRFGILALPVAIALPAAVAHAMPLFVEPDTLVELNSWAALVSATALLAAGYVVDQRTADGEDYAAWVYLPALVTLAVAVPSIWPFITVERHALILLAVGLFALSLYLRRTTFVVFGALGVVGYLGYLAFDVFRDVVNFPVLLATFGLSVIVVTVWLQRRYPALARQVEARQERRGAVPHARAVFGGAVVAALALFVGHVPGARARGQAALARVHQQQVEYYRNRRRLTTDSARIRTAPGRGAPPQGARPPGGGR
ncbi:MAG: hypothetical protein KGL38_09580 [Gemmatimonadota bacterium]|nr:hypothetical protein [Gemmatimonadota bacterium]